MFVLPRQQKNNTNQQQFDNPSINKYNDYGNQIVRVCVVRARHFTCQWQHPLQLARPVQSFVLLANTRHRNFVPRR
jgi:hypothetical protein